MPEPIVSEAKPVEAVEETKRRFIRRPGRKAIAVATVVGGLATAYFLGKKTGALDIASDEVTDVLGAVVNS